MKYQRGFAWLLPMIPYIAGAVVIATSIGALWWKAEHWCNAICKDAQEQAQDATERADALEAAHATAVKRASDLALLWSSGVDKAAAAAEQDRRDNETAFNFLADNARSIPAGNSIQLSASAARVLHDASRAANGPADSPVAARDTASADPLPRPAEAAPVIFREQDFAIFVVTAAMAYADAKGQHAACVQAYDAIAMRTP